MQEGNLSVAANSTSTNRAAGLTHEFLDRPASIVFAAAAAAVGLLTSLLIAGVAMVDDQSVSQANRFPIIPDDIVDSENVAGGRVILRFRNSTGAAIIVNWLIDVTYL
ncbi:MAG: hypothetical protein ACRCZI_03775 [Cetobacterium sp.]